MNEWITSDAKQETSCAPGENIVRYIYGWVDCVVVGKNKCMYDNPRLRPIGGTGGTRGRFRSNFFDLPLVLVVPNKAKKKAESEEIRGRRCFDST